MSSNLLSPLEVVGQCIVELHAAGNCLSQEGQGLNLKQVVGALKIYDPDMDGCTIVSRRDWRFVPTHQARHVLQRWVRDRGSHRCSMGLLSCLFDSRIIVSRIQDEPGRMICAKINNLQAPGQLLYRRGASRSWTEMAFETYDRLLDGNERESARAWMFRPQSALGERILDEWILRKRDPERRSNLLEAMGMSLIIICENRGEWWWRNLLGAQSSLLRWRESNVDTAYDDIDSGPSISFEFNPALQSTDSLEGFPKTASTSSVVLRKATP